jgi:hypothetical protein
MAKTQPTRITRTPWASDSDPSAENGFKFKSYELPEDELGVALYWHWDDFGRTDEICESLGASELTKAQKGALARMAIHAKYEALGMNRPIHYSRSKEATIWKSKKAKQRTFFSYRLVLHAADFLESHGLIVQNRGTAGTLGRQTEFKATHRLVANLAAIRCEMLKPDDPIVLRNVDGSELPIPKSRQYERMASRVDAQNNLILSTEFTSLSHLKSPLRRIFRYDMNHLGRFYAMGANWQSANNTTRRLLRLDGEPTTLLDYSACNTQIAYRLIQARAPKNPYQSDNFSRSDAKLAMMILLNASCKSEAIRAVAFDENFAGNRSNSILARRNDAELLVSELELRHPALVEEELFFGSGLKLMRAESDIADRIMTDLRKLGIVCLPIHDGFIVKRRNQSQLRECMLEHSKLSSSFPIAVCVEF